MDAQRILLGLGFSLVLLLGGTLLVRTVAPTFQGPESRPLSNERIQQAGEHVDPFADSDEVDQSEPAVDR